MGFLIWMQGLLRDERDAVAMKAMGLTRPQPAIYVEEAGVGVLLDPLNPDSVTSFMEWDRIERVTVFRPELLTAELTCLRLETSGNETLEVTDKMAGWDELLDVLPQRLAGCQRKQQILLAVAIPDATLGDLVVFERTREPGALK